MRRLLILLFLFSSSAFSADKCQLLFSDNKVELCALINPKYKIYDNTVYSIYGKLKGKSEEYLISDEVDLKAVKNTKHLENGLYYYKAYLNGNSINAENRHVLIVVNPTEIYNAGEFSYIDKNSTKNPRFYTYIISVLGKSHIEDEYKKKELVLKGKKLVLK